MTSLTCIPTAAAVADTAAVDTPAVPARHKRPAVTESIFVRLACCRDDRERRALKEQVVLLNLFLADRIAARYAGRGVDWDDLVQVARLGLIKAVVGYRPGKGAGFAAYASPTIAGEIKRHFRDHGWMIRPPRRLQELQGRLRSVEPDLAQRLPRTPSVGARARALDVEAAELSDAQVAAQGYALDSLDEPAHFGSSVSRGDGVLDQENPYCDVERAEWLRPALAQLTDRERRIIRMRFVDGLTQEQVGAQLGVSQMQACRLLKAILGRLRDHLGIETEAATA
jgi:RNA polymerase sigma-B factor